MGSSRYMSGCKSAREYKGMKKYNGESRHKDASGHNGTNRWNSGSRCKWAQVGASGLKSMNVCTRAQSDIRGQGGTRLGAAARTQAGMSKYKDVPFPFMPAHPLCICFHPLLPFISTCTLTPAHVPIPSTFKCTFYINI